MTWYIGHNTGAHLYLLPHHWHQPLFWPARQAPCQLLLHLQQGDDRVRNAVLHALTLQRVDTLCGKTRATSNQHDTNDKSVGTYLHRLAGHTSRSHGCGRGVRRGLRRRRRRDCSAAGGRSLPLLTLAAAAPSLALAGSFCLDLLAMYT